MHGNYWAEICWVDACNGYTSPCPVTRSSTQHLRPLALSRSATARRRRRTNTMLRLYSIHTGRLNRYSHHVHVRHVVLGHRFSIAITRARGDMGLTTTCKQTPDTRYSRCLRGQLGPLPDCREDKTELLNSHTPCLSLGNSTLAIEQL